MGAFACVCFLLLAGFLLERRVRGASAEYGPRFLATSSASYLMLGGERFSAYLARTDDELEKGLSGRSGLDREEAMVSAFRTPGNYAVWMPGMLFPIDVLWLDSRGVIIQEMGDMTPASYPQKFSAGPKTSSVIELPVGTIERLGLKNGMSASGTALNL